MSRNSTINLALPKELREAGMRCAKDIGLRSIGDLLRMLAAKRGVA